MSGPPQAPAARFVLPQARGKWYCRHKSYENEGSRFWPGVAAVGADCQPRSGRIGGFSRPGITPSGYRARRRLSARSRWIRSVGAKPGQIRCWPKLSTDPRGSSATKSPGHFSYGLKSARADALPVWEVLCGEKKLTLAHGSGTTQPSAFHAHVQPEGQSRDAARPDAAG